MPRSYIQYADICEPMYWTLPFYKTLYQSPPSMRRFAVRKDIIAEIFYDRKQVRKTCEVYVHTKFYIGKEPKTTISFELSEKEWDELEKTDAWKSVERFLERKKWDSE